MAIAQTERNAEVIGGRSAGVAPQYMATSTMRFVPCCCRAGLTQRRAVHGPSGPPSCRVWKMTRSWDALAFL